MTDNLEQRLRLSRPPEVSSPEHRLRLEAQLALRLQERKPARVISTARRYLVITAATMALVGALVVHTTSRIQLRVEPAFFDLLEPARTQSNAPRWRLRSPVRYVASYDVLRRYVDGQRRFLKELP